jgi:dTDP-4-dehydrorhamnose reductase
METWYGYTKLLGDAHVQLKSKKYLIVRESHKPYPFPYKVAWWDQHTNGDYVNIIVDIIVKLINKEATGVYNIGTEEKTWYEYTKDEFKTEPIEKPLNAPSDITMNLNKLNQWITNNQKK